MDKFIMEILPLCLLALGGAVIAVNAFALIGKADNLLGIERRHLAKKTQNVLSKIKGLLGITFGFLLCFCGSAVLYEKQQATIIALILLGTNAAIYFVFFIVFWLKKAKKS